MSHKSSRRIGQRRLTWIVITIVILIGLVTVPIVSAHANLVESSPSSGEQVEDAPDKLVLTYSEGVQLAEVTVESADGDRIDGDAQVDQNDKAIVHVPLEDVDNGTYVVQWEVLSVDGHTTSGSFFFVVGDEPPTREQLLDTFEEDDDEYSVTLAEPAFRSTYLAGVIILVGAPLTLLFAVYPLARRHGVDIEAADRPTHWLFGGTLLVVLLAATGLAVVQFPAQRSLSIGTVEQFLEAELGLSWLVRTGVILVLGLVTAVRVARSKRISKRVWLGAMAVGGLLLQLTMSRTSHSAAVVDGTAGILTDFGHLVGASLWLGGLVILATIVPTYLARADDVTTLATQLISRFSVLAVAGVALAGATGLAIAAWHVPTVDSLGATLYGSALSVKTLLVLIAIGLGGVNRFVLRRHLRPSADQTSDSDVVWAGPISLLASVSKLLPSDGGTVQTFVRSVRIELVILVVVLLLSGLITSIPTAANVTMSDGNTTEHVFESTVEGTDLTVRVVPGHVGPNVFDIQITENGTPVDTDEPVTLILRNPDRDVTLPEIELEQSNESTYSTVEPIPSAGTWEVRVTTWIDETYVSERYTINVTASDAGQDMSQMQAEARATDSGFGRILQYGAIGIAVGGVVAMGYELRKLRIRHRER